MKKNNGNVKYDSNNKERIEYYSKQKRIPERMMQGKNINAISRNDNKKKKKRK